MTHETEQQYKNQIAALQAEIEKLKNQQTKAIQREKYGLNWIDVPEEFDGKSKNSIPVLKEIKEKAIKNDDGKPTHILIEGDNYHVLTCLNYTHAGKIDVIYIDPPYNTGSDGFTYKDARFMTEFPNGKTVPKDDPLRHSTWLSFMEKRLRLAKNLLSDKGVIFISIDDNEQANLKLLCDQIFGEKFFLGNIDWESKTKSQNTKTAYDKLQPKVEHILVYSKKNHFNLYEKAKKEYPEYDENGCFRYYKIEMMSSEGIRGRETMIFPILGVNLPPEKQWKYGIETIKEFEERGDLILLNEYPTMKIRPIDERGEITEPFWGFISKEIGTAETAKKDLNKIFGSIKHGFDTVKPVELILKLIFHSSTPNSTILDFFAGSGTTLHATMKLNAEDGGNRQCILVQQQENDSNICETITYERNRRVMQGYTNAKGEEIAGLGNSLKYYKTDFIGKNKPEKATDEDRISLAQKAGYLISLVENTLEEIETNDFYQIFSDAEENQFTAIYFNGDTEKFPDFVQSIQEKNKKTTVYIFTWGSPDIFENEFDDLSNITIKSIPQPILEIYKSLMKNEE